MERREDLIAIHRSYYEAGADLVMTNTFGANRLKLHGCPYSVAELVTAAVENLRAARDQAGHGWLGLDIGPTGRLLAPMGDLDFDEARAAFAETIQAGAAAGADAVVIETMTDLYELKAAVLAAKESCTLPVLATVAFSENGRLLTGGDPAALVALLEGLGVDALGLNCGAGPLQLSATVRAVVELASVPSSSSPTPVFPTPRSAAASTTTSTRTPSPPRWRRRCAGASGLPAAAAAPRQPISPSSGTPAPVLRRRPSRPTRRSGSPPAVRRWMPGAWTCPPWPRSPSPATRTTCWTRSLNARTRRSRCSAWPSPPKACPPWRPWRRFRRSPACPCGWRGRTLTPWADALRRLNGKAMVTVPAADPALLALLRRYGGVACDPAAGTLIDCKVSS